MALPILRVIRLIGGEYNRVITCIVSAVQIRKVELSASQLMVFKGFSDTCAWARICPE